MNIGVSVRQQLSRIRKIVAIIVIVKQIGQGKPYNIATGHFEMPPLNPLMPPLNDDVRAIDSEGQFGRGENKRQVGIGDGKNGWWR